MGKHAYMSLAQNKPDRLAMKEPDTVFGGRLGECRSYDMDVIIAAALQKAVRELA